MQKKIPVIDSADDSEMDSERHQRTFVFRPTTEHIETRKNFFAFAAKVNLIDGKRFMYRLAGEQL